MSTLDFKIAYALVSHEGTLYAEQCYLSIYSLRKVHPNAHVAIVCDRETADTFSDGIRAKLQQECNELVILDFDKDVSPMVRSRLIKTSLRKSITGNFLYLDTDTLVRGSLSALSDLLKESKDHIWNVRDGHLPFHRMSPYNRDFHVRNAAAMGYSLTTEDMHFFNGGVSLVKDSAKAHEFYEIWHKNYLKGYNEHSIHTDQATLCLTNIQLGHMIRPMDAAYNFQLLVARKGLRNAALLHYLCSGAFGKPLFPMLDKEVYNELISTGNIPAVVDECISHPAAMIDYLSLFDDFIRRNGRVKSVVQYLLRYAFALRMRLQGR